jgi:hypothetical protein
MVGIARALIADPLFVNKLSSGHSEDIRACVGCNQACVGHRLAHHIVSCIQNPQSGRELDFVDGKKATQAKTVLVVGGGPGGMKAASTAAKRGHRVQLVEISNRLGGQVNLAEKLPGRAEFGGVTTNLVRELEQSGVEIRLNTEIDSDGIESIRPDELIKAWLQPTHARISSLWPEDNLLTNNGSAISALAIPTMSACCVAAVCPENHYRVSSGTNG